MPSKPLIVLTLNNNIQQVPGVVREQDIEHEEHSDGEAQFTQASDAKLDSSDNRDGGDDSDAPDDQDLVSDAALDVSI